MFAQLKQSKGSTETEKKCLAYISSKHLKLKNRLDLPLIPTGEERDGLDAAECVCVCLEL